MTAGSRLKPGAALTNHAEHARPRADAIEIPKRSLQAAQDGKRHQPRGRVALLEREVAPDLAERRRDRAVGRLRPVA